MRSRKAGSPIVLLDGYNVSRERADVPLRPSGTSSLLAVDLCHGLLSLPYGRQAAAGQDEAGSAIVEGSIYYRFSRAGRAFWLGRKPILTQLTAAQLYENNGKRALPFAHLE